MVSATLNHESSTKYYRLYDSDSATASSSTFSTYPSYSWEAYTVTYIAEPENEKELRWLALLSRIEKIRHMRSFWDIPWKISSCYSKIAIVKAHLHFRRTLISLSGWIGRKAKKKKGRL